MFNWLIDKTIRRIKRWFLRQYVRAVGEMYQEHLRKRSKNIPKELESYYRIEMLMNNNVTALHNLYKEAKDKNRFQEAFLYFFYEFEINLKHMIISEMMLTNLKEVLAKKLDNLFPIYSQEEIIKVQAIGFISELIDKFCLVYGKNGETIKIDLIGINRERNFIIHNMLKNEMSEGQIKESFEQFFEKSKIYIKNSYEFFIKNFDDRPKNVLTLLDKLTF